MLYASVTRLPTIATTIVIKDRKELITPTRLNKQFRELSLVEIISWKSIRSSYRVIIKDGVRE